MASLATAVFAFIVGVSLFFEIGVVLLVFTMAAGVQARPPFAGGAVVPELLPPVTRRRPISTDVAP